MPFERIPQKNNLIEIVCRHWISGYVRMTPAQGLTVCFFGFRKGAIGFEMKIGQGSLDEWIDECAVKWSMRWSSRKRHPAHSRDSRIKEPFQRAAIAGKICTAIVLLRGREAGAKLGGSGWKG